MLQNRLFTHIIYTLIIVGLIAITPVITEAHTDISPFISANNINLSVQLTPQEVPLRVTIPSVGINLDIVQSGIENGTWVVPEKSAGFAQGSSFLDQEHGNSIIFAHARYQMFRNLLDIKPNAEITIIGTDNLYVYKVSSVEKILPDEIDKLESYGENHLTLFTCEGINDEYRLLVKAKRIDTYSLKNSSKII